MEQETLNSGKVYVQSAKTKIRKLGSIEKVNRLNYYHLHFHVEVIWEMIKRHKLIISAIAVLAISTVFVVDYTGKSQNRKLYDKYFKVDKFAYSDRTKESTLESVSLFEYAVKCCQDENYKQAIPVFEGLIDNNVYFKETCQWYLAGCYIITDTDESKTTKLLIDISLKKGYYSPLSLEVLNAIKQK